MRAVAKLALYGLLLVALFAAAALLADALVPVQWATGWGVVPEPGQGHAP